MTDYIYKILPRAEWDEAKSAGKFNGSAIDLADGFIHFSNRDQLSETLEKHFSGIDDLVLLLVDQEKVSQHLKWEVSRGGDLFPHLYEPLKTCDVDSIHTLPMSADGSHPLPELI